jgi:hypothetical protein
MQIKLTEVAGKLQEVTFVFGCNPRARSVSGKSLASLNTFGVCVIIFFIFAKVLLNKL